MYFRALALAVALAAAHWGWRAHFVHAKPVAALALAQDFAATPDRVVLLGAPPRLPLANARAPLGAATGLVSARMPVDGFRSEPLLRRELSP